MSWSKLESVELCKKLFLILQLDQNAECSIVLQVEMYTAVWVAACHDGLKINLKMNQLRLIVLKSFFVLKHVNPVFR